MQDSGKTEIEERERLIILIQALPGKYKRETIKFLFKILGKKSLF